MSAKLVRLGVIGMVVTMLTTIVAGTSGALPGHPALPASASITSPADRTVIAGTTVSFDINVSNPLIDTTSLKLGSIVNYVAIRPPAELTQLSGIPPASTVPGLGSWSVRVANGRVIFDFDATVDDLGGLLPLLPATFTVQGVLNSNITDGATRTFGVTTSDDHGATPVAAKAAAAGALTITIRTAVLTVQVSATPPASLVAGEPAAISDGKTLTFGGTVKLGGKDCNASNCPVTAASLRQYSSVNCSTGPLAPINVGGAVANNNGVLAGSFTGNYDAAAQSVKLEVTIGGTAGPFTSSSACVPVDNLLPIVTARTQGAPGEDSTQVVLTFSKPMKLGSSTGGTSLNWKVTDNDNDVHLVTAIAPTGMANRALGATLTVVPPLEEDATGTITKCPALFCADTPPVQDRVGHEPAYPINFLDGVAPALAPVSKVATNIKTSTGAPEEVFLSALNGKFYSNLHMPVFRMTGSLKPGHVLTVYFLTSSGQTEFCHDTVVAGPDGPSATCESDIDFSNYLGENHDGGDRTIFVRSTDGNGNTSDAPMQMLRHDFTPPRLTSYAVSDSTITVTASEPLGYGRNNTDDWLVLADLGGGNHDYVTVDSVAGTGATRTINVADPFVQILSVQYAYSGPDDPWQRYADNAGSDLADATCAPNSGVVICTG